MILPSKHLSHERALLTVGARILLQLSEPKTVSGLWEDFAIPMGISTRTIHYNSFILAIDLLYLIGAIELHEGLISRKKA